MEPHLVLVILNHCTAVEHWIEKLQNDLPLLRGFNKQFILEGLSIILEFNYFYRNGIYIHQIKGTTMGTKFEVVGSNLLVTYQKITLITLVCITSAIKRDN